MGGEGGEELAAETVAGETVAAETVTAETVAGARADCHSPTASL